MESIAPAPKRSSTLYLLVLAGVVLGIIVGLVAPATAVKFQILGDIFIRGVKVVVSPIIFSTVVVGIAGMADLKKAAVVGGKAIGWFLLMTTVALAIGMVVANTFHPGSGIHAIPAQLNGKLVESYASQGQAMTFNTFLLHLIPVSFVGAFVEGDPLPVLFLAILSGIAICMLGKAGEPILGFFRNGVKFFFGLMGIITRYAPFAAFGAMAFTVGQFGPKALLNLGALLACVYLTCIAFVVVGLGIVARLAGFNIFKILKVIRREILIVLGTSSSESGLPGLMERLEENGCSREVVGIVVPAGYSFNLDGTCIYLTLAALFIAQALDIPLSFHDQLYVLGVLLIMSKGAAAVTGGGFITLAAALSMVGNVPVAGLALILGVDRFMSEARAITNIIGNGVAAFLISKWQGSFDESKGDAVRAGR